MAQGPEHPVAATREDAAAAVAGGGSESVGQEAHQDLGTLTQGLGEQRGGRCGFHSEGAETGSPRGVERHPNAKNPALRDQLGAVITAAEDDDALLREGALDLPLKQLDGAERGVPASPPLIAGGYATQGDAAARIFRSVTRIHVSPAWARRSSPSAISANGFDASV